MSKSSKTRQDREARPCATIFNMASAFVPRLVGGSGWKAVIECVKIFCKGGKYMRRHYLDNLRWATVLLVVFYHII